MKAITLLFLLDYSGSMEQRVDDQIKIQTLKQQSRALISTLDENSVISTAIFGSQPKNDCKDLVQKDSSPKEALAWIQNTKAGVLGKTPLAYSLKKLEKSFDEKEFKQVMVVTDGADSCGEDPCAELQKIDARLKPRNQKIKLIILGFDTKQDFKKLECFKDLDLKNFKVDLINAKNSWDIQKSFRKSQGSDEISDNEKVLELQKTNKPSPHIKNKKEPEKVISNITKINPSLSGNASIEILGAPSDAQFSLIQDQKNKNWLGSFMIQTPVGKYTLTYLNPNGKSLELELNPNMQMQIPFSEMLLVSTGDLNIQNPFVEITMEPEEQTRLMTPKAEEMIAKAQINSEQNLIKNIPLGLWQIKVTNPPWLKDRLSRKKLYFNPNATTQIEFEKIYGDELTWLMNDQPQKQRVLGLKNVTQGEESYLVPVGTLKIPIPKSWSAAWLQ